MKGVTAMPRVYQLKVTLSGTKPRIWRRLLVRDDTSLAGLHDVLQTVMGWTNSHLHQFVMAGMAYGEPDPEIDRPRLDERKVLLQELVRKPGDRLAYEYDLGDGWEHELLLEDIALLDETEKHPVILAGARACPPEDCGGPAGYAHLLEVLADPNHPEYGEMRAWVGPGFDPEAFAVEAATSRFPVNRRR